MGPGPIQIRVKIKKNRIGTIRYLGHMDKSGQKNLVYLGLGNIKKKSFATLLISLPHEKDGGIRDPRTARLSLVGMPCDDSGQNFFEILKNWIFQQDVMTE